MRDCGAIESTHLKDCGHKAKNKRTFKRTEHCICICNNSFILSYSNYGYCYIYIYIYIVCNISLYSPNCLKYREIVNMLFPLYTVHYGRRFFPVCVQVSACVGRWVVVCVEDGRHMCPS